jgi:hypothetical protein
LLAARCYTLFNECGAPFYPDVVRFALFTQKRSRVAGTEDEDEGKRAGQQKRIIKRLYLYFFITFLLPGFD